MDERWLIAAGLVVGGLLIGALAGWLVRRRLARAQRHDAASAVAGAAGLFVFWFLVLVAALVAVALVRPETLEDLPRKVLDYSPRLLVAGLIVIAGYAVAVATAGVVGYGLERASGRAVRRAALTVRWAIIAAAVILALAQLGFDTSILILLTAVVGFGVALAGALLVGLGGRDLAREIAAGRYVGRFIRTGATVRVGDEIGTVVALHPATVELQTGDGGNTHVPYTRLMESGFTTETDAEQP